MVKDARLLRQFEDNELRKEKLSYAEALKLFEEMWKEAVSLRALPLKNPLEDLDAALRVARILNSCSKSS